MSPVNKRKEYLKQTYPPLPVTLCTLTIHRLLVALCTTRFDIAKFYILPTYLCDLCVYFEIQCVHCTI